MIAIEVIGLDPPCKKCNELLDNVRQAVNNLAIEASVEKKWILSEEIRNKYGILLSPALVVNGIVVAQGKVYTRQRIQGLLMGD